MKNIQNQAAGPNYVWVFTANQACNDVAFDVITKVFDSEDGAKKYLYDFVQGDEGELAYAEEHGWNVEYNDPDYFLAFEDGNFVGNHTEAMIEKLEVKH